MKKVLIVDDSLTAREYLKYIIETAPDLCVAGEAKDGKEAVELVKSLHPDIVSMDIEMPKMNGYKACRLIMETMPVPIVMVSSSENYEQVATSFKALEAGALSVVEKPKGFRHKDAGIMVKKLIKTLRLMADIKVVRRHQKKVIHDKKNDTLSRNTREFFLPEKQRSPGIPVNSYVTEISNFFKNKDLLQKSRRIKFVVIGASTGGPPAIKQCLSELDANFPAPILVVQHITKGFLPGMLSWLDQAINLKCKIAEQNEIVQNGHVYFAPDGYHMEINSKKQITLCHSLSTESICPSVSRLFASAAKFFGRNTAGVLLTGMGKDGAAELLTIRKKGGITIAQDKESCVVFGMPGEAVRQNAANLVLSPEKIIKFFNSI